MQSNANRPLANILCFLVNKFEHVCVCVWGGCLYSEVGWAWGPLQWGWGGG